MGNDLTTTDQRTDLATQWSEPSLTPRLSELLAAKSIWETDGALPVLGGDDRAAAERALAVYAEHPRGTSSTRIGEMVGTLAASYPNGRLSDAEAKLRLKVYKASLKDIDLDILTHAVAKVVLGSKFFPTVAEIRETAGRLPAPARTVRAWRLRQLLQASEPAVIEDPIGPADERRVEKTLASLPARAGATAAPPRPEPTADDYLALGLTEDEATAALAERERMLKRRPRPAASEPAIEKAA